jgi:hypothetical protein
VTTAGEETATPVETEAAAVEAATQPEPSVPEPAPGPAPAPQQHLYTAVSDQRENVVQAFDSQRIAIRNAVAEQRRNALAPIHATNARRMGGTGRGAASYEAQMIELVLLLRAMVGDEVRRELDRRAAAAD